MSKEHFEYALFTMQTGHRPLSAFQEVFENLVSTVISGLDELEAESGGTAHRNLKIALSDTAILMVYSLIEGFFFEEYMYYFQSKQREKVSLEKAIDALLKRLALDMEKNEAINSGLAHLHVITINKTSFNINALQRAVHNVINCVFSCLFGCSHEGRKRHALDPGFCLDHRSTQQAADSSRSV